jgi:predicted homoserine dehydrogenase-like protein
MIQVGAIGYGYWGPNIVRNFNGLNGSKVVAVSDLNEESLKKVNKVLLDKKPVRNCPTRF